MERGDDRLALSLESTAPASGVGRELCGQPTWGQSRPCCMLSKPIALCLGFPMLWGSWGIKRALGLSARGAHTDSGAYSRNPALLPRPGLLRVTLLTHS